jgi:hypothetical protein
VRAPALLIALALVPTRAVADPVTPAACDRPPPAKARGLAAIDWCNFDVGAWMGPLHRGRTEVHLYNDLDQAHDTIATTLRTIDYADLDGDRRPEAFLAIERTTWIAERDQPSGGTSIAVYTLRAGKPERLGSIPVGTPVLELTVKKGVVELVSGPDRARTRHRWRAATGAFEPIVPPAKP